MTLNNPRAYGQGQPLIDVFPAPIYSNRAPAGSDIDYPFGQQWLFGDIVYELTVKTQGVATWTVLGGGTSSLATLTGASGAAAVPVAGNINILGTALQTTTTSASPTGDDLTIAFSSPSFTFPTNSIARQSSSSAAGINIIQSINTSNTAGSGAGFDSIVGGTSAADPYHYFFVTGAAEWIIGIDNSDSDTFKISASSSLGTNDDMTIAVAGAITFPRGDVSATRANVGSNVIITASNTDNTNAASGAGFNSIVGGAAAGDPYHFFSVTGGGSYIIGLDNSASAFKISASTALGTSDVLALTTANTSIAQGNLSITNGDIILNQPGNGITIAEGANATIGQATLAGGTVTVNTTAIGASGRVFLSRASVGATGAAATGNLAVGVVTPGVSFVINAVQAADATALQASDVSVINWWIIS